MYVPVVGGEGVAGDEDSAVALTETVTVSDTKTFGSHLLSKTLFELYLFSLSSFPAKK